MKISLAMSVFRWGLAVVLLGLLLVNRATAQRADSLQLQQAAIQDTFLLRIIPDYINRRMNEPRDKRFHQKGVIFVIVPRVRRDTMVCYRLYTTYENYGFLKSASLAHPLFYTQIMGRYVVVCDEWTGSLVGMSQRSLQRAIDRFTRAGWLYSVRSDLESITELHSLVYCWRPKPWEGER